MLPLRLSSLSRLHTLTRLPAARPIAARPQAPLVVAFQLSLIAVLIVGMTLQLMFLKRTAQATVIA